MIPAVGLLLMEEKVSVSIIKIAVSLAKSVADVLKNKLLHFFSSFMKISEFVEERKWYKTYYKVCFSVRDFFNVKILFIKLMINSKNLDYYFYI